MGVGTASPSAKLHVDGDIKAAGALFPSGGVGTVAFYFLELPSSYRADNSACQEGLRKRCVDVGTVSPNGGGALVEIIGSHYGESSASRMLSPA